MANVVSDDGAKMTPDELLETMRALLQDEREAIRRFDSEAISRANDAKSAILDKLRTASTMQRPALYAVLDQLQPELRCNLILLTHARSYVRDMQEELDAELSNVPFVMRKSA